jgi:hypothetical protein
LGFGQGKRANSMSALTESGVATIRTPHDPILGVVDL